MTEADIKHCEDYVAFRGADLATARHVLRAEIARFTRELKDLKKSIRRRLYAARFISLPEETRKKLGADQMKALRLEGKLAARQDALESIGDPILAERYWTMRAIPRVRDISIIDRKIFVIETEMLYGKCAGGVWRRVGMFTIRVPKPGTTSQIMFTPGEGTTRWNSYLAPTNVGTNGKVSCYGDADGPISDALKAWNDVALVNILVRYLECPGHNNRLENWPPAALEEVPRWYIETFGE